MTTLIEPLKRDEELLADIAAGRATDDDHLRLWWLGQAGFLVQWRGRHLLLDRQPRPGAGLRGPR